MQLFSIKKIVGDIVSFSVNDENHIKNILRKKINDELMVTDSANNYFVRIVTISPLRAKITKKVIIDCDPKINISLYCGVIKKNNFELLTQKAVELGVNKIYPVFFQRSQKNIIYNIERLQTIINEAKKQCHRMNEIIISKPIEFNDLIELIDKNDLNITAYEKIKEFSINNINIKNPKNINLIIGPEGGIDPIEIEKLKHLNCYFVSLTKSILRTETAAFYLISNVINKWEER